MTNWWTREDDPNCSGCDFWSSRTCTCDYAYILGRRRPCPPGADCLVSTAKVPFSPDGASPRELLKKMFDFYQYGRGSI